MEIKNTKTVGANGIKVLVYGKAGIGKTTLMATAPKPIVLSCESGLLSLKDAEIDYIEIETINDITEAYTYLVEGGGKDKYETICLDSISEISEVVLSALKQQYKDPRQAYGELNDEIAKLVRRFRDIPGKNVVFSAKRARIEDNDTSVVTYMPMMPGKTLTQGMPFFFDEVFYMDIVTDDEGKEHRGIHTDAGYGFEAKDRSGKLGKLVRPDLTHLFNKILGVSNNGTA